MRYLVTGAAGFIGSYTARLLLEQGNIVVGLDSVNDYYRSDLKEERLSCISQCESAVHNPDAWNFYRGSLEDRALLSSVFERHSFDVVIHLAAQAGVRYSITNPLSYSSSNLEGFLNILESCRNYNIKHLAFASSSSVYGLNQKVPFSERDPVDHPVSLYAATKRANELMAHSYSMLYKLPVTGMRFFTVYGPQGRPDMAYFKFADAIMQKRPIDIYNNGDLKRDFTYVDDVVKAITLIAQRPATADSAFNVHQTTPDRSSAPFRIYNIGNQHPEKLEDFIGLLETKLGTPAIRNYLPMQPGDVYMTAADTQSLYTDFGWHPSTPLEIGLEKFTNWYKERKPWLQ